MQETIQFTVNLAKQQVTAVDEHMSAEVMSQKV